MPDPLRGKLKRLVKEADVYVFDTYSNAQKLPWQHVEENCRQAMLVLKKITALLAESEPAKAPELAWLIESRLTPSPTWWTGSDWTGDSLKAVRFCRKQDAEAALATLPDKHVCLTSEHQWGFGGESEPEPDECPFPSPEHRGESGCPCNPIDGKCVYCGAPEPELLAAPTTDCEAKAKLPLGHEFVAAVDSLGRASKSSADFCGECGQPRSAHEPR